MKNVIIAEPGARPSSQLDANGESSRLDTIFTHGWFIMISLCIFWCNSVSAQYVTLDVRASLIVSTTPGCTTTFSLADKRLTVSENGTTADLKIRMLPDIDYDLNISRSCNSFGGQIEFLNIPECYGLEISGTHPPAIRFEDNIYYDHDDTFGVKVKVKLAPTLGTPVILGITDPCKKVCYPVFGDPVIVQINGGIVSNYDFTLVDNDITVHFGGGQFNAGVASIKKISAKAAEITGQFNGHTTVRAKDANNAACYVDIGLCFHGDGNGRNCRDTGDCPCPPYMPLGCNPPPEPGPRRILGNGRAGVQHGAVSVELGLGSATDESGLGDMEFNLSQPDQGAYTPANLSYGSRHDDAQVIETGGRISQIKVPAGLVDVATLDSNTFKVSFVGSESVGSLNEEKFGFVYTNIYESWIFENPDVGISTNRLKVTEQKTGASDVVYMYSWQTNGWMLDLDNGLGQITEIVSWSTNSNPIRTETWTIVNSNGTVIAASSKKYEHYSFGPRVIEDVIGSGMDARTNTYSYNSTNGLTEKMIRWDGYWEWRYYDDYDRPSSTYSAFLNQSITNNEDLCRLVVNDYSPASGSGDDGTYHPGLPRKITESVLGEVVSLQYNVHLTNKSLSIVCLSPSADWDTTGNLYTTNNFFTNGYHFGQIQSIEHPDGTMSIYQYGTTDFKTYASNAVFNTTNIVLTGQPDSGHTYILAGTKSISVTGPAGEPLSQTTIDISSGITNSHIIYSEFDAVLRPRRMDFLDGTYSYSQFGCCAATTTTNREGSVTSSVHDDLGRVLATTFDGITQSNVYDAAGNVLKAIRIGSDNSSITLMTNAYNSAGLLTRSVNAENLYTDYSQSIDASSQVIKSTTIYTNSGSGPKRIEVTFRDGSLNTVTGGLVYPLRYEYGPTNEGRFVKEIKLNNDGTDSSEWVINFYDLASRPYKTLYADEKFSQIVYNAKGQFSQEIDPDGVSTVYQYNDLGEQSHRALDMDRGNDLDLAGTDRVTSTVSDVATVDGVEVQRTRTYQWFTMGTDSSSLVSEVCRSTDGLQSWSVSFGLTSRTDTYFPGSGSRYVTNTAPDGSHSISSYLHGKLQSVTRNDADDNQLGITSYTFDAHGRQTIVSDARNGSTTNTFDNMNRIVSISTPPPSGSGAGLTTQFVYDKLGRVVVTTYPDGTSVTNTYTTRGELSKTVGSRNYPVEYHYDSQGRMTTMTTWQNYPSSGSATTTWTYDSQRGFLTAKSYDGGAGAIAYDYTPAGRLYSRTWDRGITTLYTTNAAGDIATIGYSDTTPTITYYADRAGRKTNIVDGVGNHFYSYDNSGRLLGEAHTSGALTGLSLTNGYDSLLRRSTGSFYTNNATSAFELTHLYDAASRLTNVTDGTYSAGYKFIANSALIDQISFRDGSTERMTTTRTYDYLNRLTQMLSIPGGTGQDNVSHEYQYNEAGQRTRQTDSLDAYWIYQYDELGQVVSGRKYWSDGTPVAGQQYDYEFDDIGNRTETGTGGNQWGDNLRQADYTVNSLNQYTSRDVPGVVDIIGVAQGDVTVNEEEPYRYAEYFWKDLAIDNAAGPVYAEVSNEVVFQGQTNSVDGHVLLSKAAEVFTYDDDGNMTSNGLWTNRWNGENRLIEQESLAAVPDDAKWKLAFTYDHQGRRVTKVVSNWTGSAWAFDYKRHFIYDGWNLVAELDENNTVVKSYIWGTDLSGGRQGAGGVGGLLAMKVHDGANAGTYFYAYDGNGNVTGLIDGDDGTIVARYEYGPFGEIIRATGDMATENPFRFSTKYQDKETQLYYYGFRYYDTDTGRWPNRDPIEEQGGLNLYAFIGNDPISLIDYLGLLAVGDVINTDEGVVKIIRQPTSTDRDMGNKGVCVVSKLIDVPQWPPWNVLWITDMPVEGLNYRAGFFSKDRTEYVFIEQSMVPKAEWNLNAMLGYGIVLAHETDHYYTNSTDPETRQRINDRAWEAARKAEETEINCKKCIQAGFWKIRNLLEKYACECGIDLSKKPGRDILK